MMSWPDSYLSETSFIFPNICRKELENAKLDTLVVYHLGAVLASIPAAIEKMVV